MSKELKKGDQVELLPHTKEEMLLNGSWNPDIEGVIHHIGTVEAILERSARLSFKSDTFGWFIPLNCLKTL